MTAIKITRDYVSKTQWAEFLNNKHIKYKHMGYQVFLELMFC